MWTKALKPKPESRHLSIIINTEGKEVQAETRDDEEQKVKQLEITDLFIGNRVFIKVLSAIGKVASRMAWCINSCDVDLLFQ